VEGQEVEEGVSAFVWCMWKGRRLRKE
jgi:hypothetical protein